MTAHTLQMMREVHSRRGDGIQVRMLWCERDERVTVAVDDTKSGDAFAIDVRKGERAMDVFLHPFAYAASRAVPLTPTYPLADAA
jgi:hypothetical protein